VTLPKISWANVAKAISFYTHCGFSYVEVPWVVTDEAVNITLPPGVQAQRCQDGPLVGSGEQSLLQMALDGDLMSGRYVAASPCFRDDAPDVWHQRTFFKVEAMELSMLPIPDAHHRVEELADLALRFLGSLEGGEAVEIVETAFGLDIELYGIELGSYGYRSFGDLHWIYGTGYADPRFTLASTRTCG